MHATIHDEVLTFSPFEPTSHHEIPRNLLSLITQNPEIGLDSCKLLSNRLKSHIFVTFLFTMYTKNGVFTTHRGQSDWFTIPKQQFTTLKESRLDLVVSATTSYKEVNWIYWVITRANKNCDKKFKMLHLFSEKLKKLHLFCNSCKKVSFMSKMRKSCANLKKLRL